MAFLNFFKKPKKEKTRLPQRGGIVKTAKGKRERKVKPRNTAPREEKEKRQETAAPVVLKESRSAWRILRAPHVTEKSADLANINQYVFKVIGNPAKREVKKAIEETHSVSVKKVRKISVPGKQRRRGRHVGWKPGYKKMIVALKEGDKIEVLPH